MPSIHKHYAEYIPEAGAPRPVVSRPTRSPQIGRVVRPIIVRNGRGAVAAPTPLVTRSRRAIRPAQTIIVVKGGSTQGAPTPLVTHRDTRRRALQPLVVRGGVAQGAPRPQVVVPRRRPGRPQLAIIISSHPTPAPPQQADSWISIDTAGVGVIPPAASYLRLEVEVA